MMSRRRILQNWVAVRRRPLLAALPPPCPIGHSWSRRSCRSFSSSRSWRSSSTSIEAWEEDDAVVTSTPPSACLLSADAVRVDHDGQSSVFDALWLWSQDPSIVHASSGQKLRSPMTGFGWTLTSAIVVPASEAPSSSAVTLPVPPPAPGCLHPLATYTIESNVDPRKQQYVLQVTWKSSITYETRQSFFDVDWLWRCRYDDHARQARRRATEVTPSTALHRSKALTVVDFVEEDWVAANGASVTNEAARWTVLRGLVEDGAVLLRNVPACRTMGSTQRQITGEAKYAVGWVGKALAGGQLSHGQLYGDIFHVQAALDNKAHNLAYTNVPLPPHQDLAYYEAKPGLQLLHCVNTRGVRGGESLLIDGLAAAHEFRRLAPDLFEILTQCPATFLKQRNNADMVYRRQHIQVDADGVVVAVHYSPPFQGPMQLPPAQMKDYFVAIAAWERMLDHSLSTTDFVLPVSRALEQSLLEYAHEFTWERKLQEGEMLIFNNQRLFHGRRGFDLVRDSPTEAYVDDSSQPYGRHLIGCYTNLDDTLNQYRMLRRQHERSEDQGDLSYVRNAGNGSSGTL